MLLGLFSTAKSFLFELLQRFFQLFAGYFTFLLPSFHARMLLSEYPTWRLFTKSAFLSKISFSGQRLEQALMLPLTIPH